MVDFFGSSKKKYDALHPPAKARGLVRGEDKLWSQFNNNLWWHVDDHFWWVLDDQVCNQLRREQKNET